MTNESKIEGGAVSPSSDKSRDKNLKGILLAFLAFVAFSFSDASVKLIEGKLPPYESAFFGAVFALLVVPFIMKREDKLSDIFRTNNRPLWLVRFWAYPAGVIGSVTAFTHLPMAEAFVLIFLQPTFVTILSILFLKEKVGVRRWAAVAIGFIGVLIVLRPGFRELSIGHLGATFAGLGGAIAIVSFRAAGANEKQISLFGSGILGALLICGTLMIGNFEIPTWQEWLMLAGYGLLAALANIIMMHATINAPAVYISTTQYSQMIWAIIIGYLVFGDKVDLPMLVGILFIIGSGVITLVREDVKVKEKVAEIKSAK